MAVTYLNQYALQGGTTGLTMTPPASSAAGDMDIIYVANKNSSVTPTTPAGWTLIPNPSGSPGTAVVGTGADGAGTGQVRITAWYRILSGASTATSVTITGANRSLGGGMIYRKGAGETWGVPSMSFGSDITSGTAFAALMADNLGVLVGEFLLSVGVFTNIVALNGRDITTPGLTQTSVGINSFGNTTGNHLFIFTDHTQPSAGTQSGASSTIATGGGATTGGAINIRVGLSAASNYTQSPADAEGLTDSPASSLGKVAADNEGLADSTAADLSKALADALGLSDAPALGQDKPAFDSLGLTDTAVLAWGIGAAATDSETLTDAATFEAVRSSLQVDALGLSDGAQVALGKITSDDLGLSDSTAIAVSVGLAVSDVLGLTDTATSEAGISQAPTDSEALTDAVALAAGKALDDPLGVTDTVTLSAAHVLSIADAADLNDSTNVVLVGAGSVTPVDNEDLTDAVQMDRTTPVTDTEQLADAASVALAGAHQAADIVDLTDTIEVISSRDESPADPCDLTDQIALVITRDLGDTITVTDAADLTAAFARVLDDNNTGLTDGVTISLIGDGGYSEATLTVGNAPSSQLTATNPRPALTGSNAPSSQLEVSHGV